MLWRSVHGPHSDVAEVGRDVARSPQTGGVLVKQGKDPVSAALGEGGVPVVPGGGGRRAPEHAALIQRVLVPLTAADQPQTPPEIRRALRTLDHQIEDRTLHARLVPAT